MAGTIFMIAVLAVIIIFAAVFSVKHFKGEGGCCGGSSEKPKSKKLNGTIIARKIVTIEGMHCRNCKNKVEQQINRLEGISAKVSLKKKCAVVSMTQMVSDDELRQAVSKAGFQVTGIV